MLVLKRETVLVAALAVAIHVFLFLTLHVSADGEGMLAPPPPRTSYLGANERIAGAAETDVRLIQSPVIFAVPSAMGFSRELLAQKARTRIILSQPKQTEQFLSVVPLEEASARIPRNLLMVSAIGGTKPRLPDAAVAVEKRPAARRVFMVPALKHRLIGGVVLPAALNQESPAPWEVHALISVSTAGTVEHVFVEQPLESAALNQEVLQLLYRLRFKPGAQVDGSIEIYSPESVQGKEVEPW